MRNGIYTCIYIYICMCIYVHLETHTFLTVTSISLFPNYVPRSSVVLQIFYLTHRELR